EVARPAPDPGLPPRGALHLAGAASERRRGLHRYLVGEGPQPTRAAGLAGPGVLDPVRRARAAHHQNPRLWHLAGRLPAALSLVVVRLDDLVADPGLRFDPGPTLGRPQV